MSLLNSETQQILIFVCRLLLLVVRCLSKVLVCIASYKWNCTPHSATIVFPSWASTWTELQNRKIGTCASTLKLMFYHQY